eukprot:scaffold182031_cov33-Tisochrysis_lutea.AAC.1
MEGLAQDVMNGRQTLGEREEHAGGWVKGQLGIERLLCSARSIRVVVCVSACVRVMASPVQPPSTCLRRAAPPPRPLVRVRARAEV